MPTQHRSRPRTQDRSTASTGEALRSIFNRNFNVVACINLLVMTAYYLMFVTSTAYARATYGASLSSAGLTAGIMVIGCLIGRFLTGGDVEVKKRRVNANYQRKVVDFVNKMEHDYQGYERQIQDPKTNDFDRAEYILKSNELQSSKDFQKAYELKSYIEAIADFEKWLKEFGDNEDMENQLYELKLRALEIAGEKE